MHIHKAFQNDGADFKKNISNKPYETNTFHMSLDMARFKV
jgi:hypothetical protein